MCIVSSIIGNKLLWKGRKQCLSSVNVLIKEKKKGKERKKKKSECVPIFHEVIPIFNSKSTTKVVAVPCPLI